MNRAWQRFVAAGVIAACAGLLVGGACYQPPVRDMVTLVPSDTGETRVHVDTLFKQGEGVSWAEHQEILRVLDAYDLGRDAWLRGFERAGARDIAHHCQGPEASPERIVREAVLPSVESMATAMPDAIANFSLRREDAAAGWTLRIVHIDTPSSLRENWRRLEKEVEALSRDLYRAAERQCELYDYLAANPDRRAAALEALERERFDLKPEEAVLVAELKKHLERVLEYLDTGEDGGPSHAIASMTFSGFDEDLCVELPGPGVNAVGLVHRTEAEREHTWCLERIGVDDLIERTWPESDPGFFDHVVRGRAIDPVEVARLPFTCLRFRDEIEVRDRIWDEILPRPWYEITWRESEGPPEPSSVD